MWHVTQLDIEKTLSKVARRVTHDKSVANSEISKKRREGIYLLGQIYVSHGSKAGTSVEAILSSLTDQMQEQQQESYNHQKQPHDEAASDTNARCKASSGGGASSKQSFRDVDLD